MMVSIGAQFWVVCYLIAGVTLPVIIFMALVFPKRLVQFGDWLKGSSRFHLLGTNGDLYECGPKAAFDLNWGREKNSIEIRRLLFGNAKIRGPASGTWEIADHWVQLDLNERVSLSDKQGLSLGTTLRIVNKYGSLQAMFDRIAELEAKLAASERQRKNKLAAIKAALRLINVDRNQYRSKTSQRIRKWLEVADRSTDPGEIWPSADAIQKWIDGLSKVTEEKA